MIDNLEFNLQTDKTFAHEIERQLRLHSTAHRWESFQNSFIANHNFDIVLIMHECASRLDFLLLNSRSHSTKYFCHEMNG